MSNQEPEKKSSISDKILKKQIALRNSSLNKILPLKIMYILAATFICIALLLGYKPFVRYGEYSSIYGEVFFVVGVIFGIVWVIGGIKFLFRKGYKMPAKNTRITEKTINITDNNSAVNDRHIITWILIVVVTVVLIISYNASQYVDKNPSTLEELMSSNTSWQDFNSTKFGFTVQFPGFATSENTSIDMQGTSVPYTTYSKYVGDIGYVVGVFEYPMQFDLSDVDAHLEDALNGSVQNQESPATLVSSTFSNFKGYRSINGVISITNGGKTYELYELAFLKGNSLYVLIAIGVSQSDFNKFTNSFNFT